MRCGLTEGLMVALLVGTPPLYTLATSLSSLNANFSRGKGGAAVSPLCSVPHAPLLNPCFFRFSLRILRLNPRINAPKAAGKGSGGVQNEDFVRFVASPTKSAFCIIRGMHLITEFLPSPIFYHGRKEKIKPCSDIGQETQDLRGAL